MTVDNLRARFAPLLEDVIERATIAERLIDRDLYRVLVTTVWANVVLDPDAVGISEAELEDVHDIVNEQVAQVLGGGNTLTECFRYISSKPGEKAMAAARLTQNHKDLLLYFASMILDPEGHQRWTDSIRSKLDH